MDQPTEPAARSGLALPDTVWATLVRVIRVAFPHPRLPDGPYERVTQKIATDGGDSTWLGTSLLQGLRTLDALADRPFVELPDDAALNVLKRVAHLEFFAFIRRTTVLSLYDDPEVWNVLGYEGESFSQGGYLHRGFDDLDWLPDPRIEESGEDPPELGPLGYDVTTAAPKAGWGVAARAATETTDQPFGDLFKGSDIVNEGTTAS